MPYALPTRTDDTNHVADIVSNWWRTNIGSIMNGARFDLERIIDNYIAKSIQTPEMWENLNIFMEYTPVAILDVLLNQAIYNKLKPHEAKLKSFPVYYSALEIVMRNRSMDQAVFEAMFHQ